MKKITLTCAMILAVSAGVFARNSTTPAQLAEIKAKNMKQEYYMSDAQYKQSLAIETDFYTQTMHSDGTRPSADEMKVINEQRDAKYKKLLPVDQYAKYDAVKKRTAPHNVGIAQPAAGQPAQVAH